MSVCECSVCECVSHWQNVCKLSSVLISFFDFYFYSKESFSSHLILWFLFSALDSGFSTNFDLDKNGGISTVFELDKNGGFFLVLIFYFTSDRQCQY